jgi:hypothetical protein
VGVNRANLVCHHKAGLEQLKFRDLTEAFRDIAQLFGQGDRVVRHVAPFVVWIDAAEAGQIITWNILL